MMKMSQCVTNLLHDAYCMEQASEMVLLHRVQERSAFPLFQMADQQHLSETRLHLQQIASCLERYGDLPAACGPETERMLHNPVPAPPDASSDQIIKNFMVDYAAEQFEIITYQALIEAAAQVGDVQTVEIAEQILRDEQRRAARISRNLPIVVAAHLSETAALGLVKRTALTSQSQASPATAAQPMPGQVMAATLPLSTQSKDFA